MALTPEEAAELAQLEAELQDGPKPAPKKEIGALEGFGRGAMEAAQKASRGIVDTAAWLGSDYVGGPLKNTLIKYGLAPSNEQLATAKARTEEAGGWGATGRLATDVATQIIPAGMAAKAMAIRGAVPFIDDVVGNVGVATAMAPNEEKKEAATGAVIGSGVGKVLAKTLGGPLRTFMTEDAKKLMSEGVGLTPGQMVSGTGSTGGARMARGAENIAGSIPLVGMPIKYRASKAVEDYNVRALNNLVEDLGGKVTKPGREGVDEAFTAFDKALKEATPNLYVDQNKAIGLIDDLPKALRKADTTYDPRAMKTIEEVLDVDISPHVINNNLDGDTAYKIGKRIESQVKKYQGKQSVADQDRYKGFVKLRDQWYDLMEPKVGADPAYKDIIDHIQKNKRKWYNFRDAAELTPEGIFTPAQVKRVNKGFAPDELTNTAFRVLPKELPRTNSGVNAALHRVMTPAGVSGLSGAAAVGGSGAMGVLGTALPYVALASAMYTKPVGKYLASGATPLVNSVMRKINSNAKLTPEELEFATSLLSSQALRSTVTNKPGD